MTTKLQKSYDALTGANKLKGRQLRAFTQSLNEIGLTLRQRNRLRIMRIVHD
ncbi:MAG TPA: hypothetical protein VK404_16785 [Spirosoma sp.]|jgi:hypothetical protein|nr:hypothetical protein [Spirosoma sp.]